MKEIWKEIEDHDGYFISNYGRVKSIRLYRGSIEPRILTPRKHSRGYVNINLDGKNYYIHRLVAQAFIPNPEGLEQVNHIDEQKNNNVYTNLEWISNYDNAMWGTRNQRTAKKNSIPVVSVEISTGHVQYHVSGRQASKTLGIQQSNMNKVLKKIYAQTGGYKFYYKTEYEKLIKVEGLRK